MADTFYHSVIFFEYPGTKKTVRFIPTPRATRHAQGEDHLLRRHRATAGDLHLGGKLSATGRGWW